MTGYLNVVLNPLRISGWCALEANFASAVSFDHPARFGRFVILAMQQG